jgi:hypothetical protein
VTRSDIAGAQLDEISRTGCVTVSIPLAWQPRVDGDRLSNEQVLLEPSSGGSNQRDRLPTTGALVSPCGPPRATPKS